MDLNSSVRQSGKDLLVGSGEGGQQRSEVAMPLLRGLSSSPRAAAAAAAAAESAQLPYNPRHPFKDQSKRSAGNSA